ncbi:hypothetical protein GQ457_05G013180 [Hibiscus cannabinus]
MFALSEANMDHCTVASFIMANGDWDVDRLLSLLPSDCIQCILAILPPSPMYGLDRIGWKGGPNFKFNVKSAYRRLSCHFGMIQDNLWSYVWRLCLPQRIRAFLWLAIKGKLLTHVERSRRHMTNDELCEICKRMREGTLHVLRNCPKPFRVWQVLIKPDRMSEFLSLSLFDCIFSNNREKEKERAKNRVNFIAVVEEQNKGS